MGASKSTTNATNNAELIKPEHIPVKANSHQATGKKHNFSDKLQAKEDAAVAPISLPTQSWRSLLQEPSMSADAKPFVPSPAQPTRHAPAAAKPAATSAKVTDQDPEWMQYLSKKFQSTAPIAPTFKPSVSSRAGKDGKGKGKGKGAALPIDAGGTAAEGPAAGSRLVIQTEAYLKLLREGFASGGKRKPTRPQKTSNVERLSADGLSISDAAQSDALQPITTSSLAKKWSSMVNKQSGQNDDITAEAETEVRPTQDDIGIEKLLLDQDLSDPAYYSDSEPVVAKPTPSMHRLGRRPKASTAAIRTYVMQDLSFLLDQAVGMLLLRLQRFMNDQRMFAPCDAISEQQAQQYSQRRFVIGLKEVSRRTRQSKVECLIVAPDIEEDADSGGLDDRMRELLASAYQNQTPVVFALSRARLGKALGKSLHISVLGVLDSTGARSLLDESLLLADECRQAWLARLQK